MSAGANFLYAANFRSGAVDVFDKNYSPVTLGAHAFWDPRIPRKFAPFNVQNINGMIFVSCAKQDDAKHDEVDGRGSRLCRCVRYQRRPADASGMGSLDERALGKAPGLRRTSASLAT